MQRASDVKACSPLAKKQTGIVVMRWTILASGATDQVSVAASTLSGALSSCLLKKVRRWRFPKAKGPTRVNYTFRFGA
jgi:TonB family protein